LLAQTGRETAAFVGFFVLDSRFGLDQGFATCHDRFENKPDGESFGQR